MMSFLFWVNYFFNRGPDTKTHPNKRRGEKQTNDTASTPGRSFGLFTNDTSDVCELWHMSAARLMSPSDNCTSSISNETPAWLLLPNLLAV